MGAIADVTSEFKQGGAKEKTLIIIGVVAVAGVAYYVYRYRQQTASQQGVLPSQQTSMGQSAGYPMAGSVPVLPGGVNPVYDPSGNLVAFQNPLVNTGIISGQTPRSYTSLLGTLAPNTQIRAGGSDTNGERFWIGQTGNAASQLFYAPTGTKINYGGAGRVWITAPGGTQQLLTKAS